MPIEIRLIRTFFTFKIVSNNGIKLINLIVLRLVLCTGILHGIYKKSLADTTDVYQKHPKLLVEKSEKRSS